MIGRLLISGGSDVVVTRCTVTRAYATMQAAALLLSAAGCDKARSLESFTVLLDILEAKAK
jgi:hypothetical protein